MTWRDRPACLDEDPELFFPIGSASGARRQTEKARVVCRRCDAREACLEWALGSDQDIGVWGGLSEDQRRALRRRQARTHLAGRGAPSPPGGRSTR